MTKSGFREACRVGPLVMDGIWNKPITQMENFNRAAGRARGFSVEAGELTPPASRPIFCRLS
jgi:hypothetical protein